MHSNNPVYDVAITGGGLAGLCTAIQCAGEGYRVLLLEKEQYPFHKVCGEYISMESWPFLEKLGVPLQQLQLPSINRLCATDPKGRAYHFNLPLGGFGISRYLLDHLLYHIAVEKGVAVHTQEKVLDIHFADERFVIQTSRGSMQARTAVGSFGKRSNLDTRWARNHLKQKPGKLNHYIGVKYHIRYPQPPEQISLHNFNNGYCGISRIENDTCCLCYLTTAANLAASGNSITAMEQQLLSQNPHLRGIFRDAVFLYSKPLTISQVNFHQKEQVWGHVLLAGDAAGLITPLCGNGMSMAMHAGKLAFESISLFLKGTRSRAEMEQLYIRQWNHQFGLRLAVGRGVQRLFGNTHTTALFFRSMQAFPLLARQLIRSTHGQPF